MRARAGWGISEGVWVVLALGERIATVGHDDHGHHGVEDESHTVIFREDESGETL